MIADYVLSEQWRLLGCLTVLADCDVVFVGIRCSPDELRRRERERGDRHAGRAAAQLKQVHAHGSYDIECDSTTASPFDCAMLIKEYLSRRTAPTAFDRLRSILLTGQDAPR